MNILKKLFPFVWRKTVESTLQQSEGGLFIRLDENRELMELLQKECPEFLANHFWAEHILKSHDKFLLDLIKATNAPGINMASEQLKRGFRVPVAVRPSPLKS